ncbi:MAG: complex I NDUFA9 subunit family protein [Gammaproteobacteria bacterium]|nr:complex I NDUFA9 subunit family protein [Gammaproteobacteria bacterium]NNC68153.1 complex I NDUFA9 subunit family protein [Gammaproteobacteria bacterium]
MKNLTICILGGTGFIGSHLCAELVGRGHHLKVLTRQRERHRALLVLPSLDLIQVDIHNESDLKQHFENCDAVINLVGILNEKGHDGSGFKVAHVELARKVITMCSTHKVPRLLHMSALNASPDEKSFYLRTKGEAENYVHTFAANKIAVTSFRPSVIFGAEDSFINRFANILKITPIMFPLACPDTKFAPVYVDDVVQIMANALTDKQTFGQRINLCGPKQYSLKELVKYVAYMSNLRRTIIGLPNWASKLQANILEFLPGKPFSVDNYLSLQKDSVCSDDDILCPTSLESIVPGYLQNKSSHKQFRAKRSS